MNKKNHTSSSITTIIIVMVIAIVVLLVGNYTKNFNSGVALEYEITNLANITTNQGDTDKIDITTSGDNLVLNILGTAQPNAGYGMKIEKILYRGSDVNVRYSITQPETTKPYLTIITYPFVSIHIGKNSLPIGAALNFNFYNSTTKTKQTITYMIKI